MSRWIGVVAVVAILAAVWYVLTDPSGDEATPGGLSSHQVDQPFDPYIDDDEAEADSGMIGATEPDRLRDESNEEIPPPAPSHEPGEDARDRESLDGPQTAAAGTRGDDNTGEPSTASPPADDRLTAREAARIADAYLQSAADDPNGLLDQYAERVNYYDEGTVSREDVLRDKRNYLERWPERSYRRTSDPEMIDAGAADLIRFNYQFRVAGGSRDAEGSGWAELGVKKEGGRLMIVSERGGVIDQD